MVKVSNGACIRHLARKSLRASRSRNLVAVLAIALTTVLFTSLFTIGMSLNEAFQQNTFRQVGGWSHGTFKYLTEEQFNELREDPLIKDWGLRRFLGMPTELPFNKSHVEIGFSDANQAHWMFCDPVEGRLPQEGTDEAATDTRVLELLGVEPVLGAEFTVFFDVDGRETTQTFTLCGWWEYDEAVVASHILVPESRVNAVLEELGVDPKTSPSNAGAWGLDVMLGGSLHIERDIETILANHGYQNESRSNDGDYIMIGVNWAYTGAQLSDSIEPTTVLAIAAMLLLIIFTGYLIIYNVFQISVTNDIRFYGLLKTIGTTGRQIRRIIRQQALTLSLAGIPLGLLLGWLVGARLTPVILNRLNGVKLDVVSASPAIFLGAALFALVTVTISCRKPGRMAARVSPVEAVRYTEGAQRSGRKGRQTARAGAKTRKAKNVSLFSMARANLGRSRSKSVVTILSLTLAVVLLNMTYTFTNGFDMDKYVSNFVATDFVVADANYFQVGGDNFSADTPLPEEVIGRISAQGGIAEGGRVYGRTSAVQEFVEEDYYRSVWSRWNPPEVLDMVVKTMDRSEDGRLADNAQLYGMEPFALDSLRVLEGDLSKLYEPGGRYVAAVYHEDDYGNPRMESHWARLGETVTLRYVEEFEYYNRETGEIYEGDIPEDAPFNSRAVKYRDVEYEVAALVSIPQPLSYRYYASDEFILNDRTFVQDTGTDAVMLYAFDVTGDAANAAMESFLADYTENQNPQCDYESRATYVDEFEDFRSMFLLLGGTLSLIVGLVGVLNFFNAVLTGILTRRREFAVLQSIGMTGEQLKTMLVWEGLCYALGAAALALVLSAVLGPLLGTAVGGMFWFFTYQFTLLPVLCVAPIFALLGVLLPLAAYRPIARQSLVERLRMAE